MPASFDGTASGLPVGPGIKATINYYVHDPWAKYRETNGKVDNSRTQGGEYMEKAVGDQAGKPAPKATGRMPAGFEVPVFDVRPAAQSLQIDKHGLLVVRGFKT